jgi:hypothetical protein
MTDLETRLRDGLHGHLESPDVDRFLTGVRRGVAWRRGRRASAGVAALAAAVIGGSVLLQQRHDPRTVPQPITHGPSPTVTTPPLPRDALSQVLDVDVSDAGVLRLTTNISCLGCSTVWRQTADGQWQHLFDFTGRAAYGGEVDPLFGPVSYLTMAADGQDGYAWGHRLWSTHDGGRSWKIVHGGPGAHTPRGHWTSIGPTSAWSVYDGRILYRSDLGSDTWRFVNSPEIGTIIGVLPDDRVVLLTYPGEGTQARLVYGAGTSWSSIPVPCGEGGPGSDNPAPPPVVQGTTVFVVCGTKVETRTLDGTRAWKVIGRLTGTAVAVLPLDDHRVLVQTRTATIYDTRGSHHRVNMPLPRGEQLVRISVAGRAIWVVGIDGTVDSSADGGEHWQEEPVNGG